MSFMNSSSWNSQQPLKLVPLCDKCGIHKQCHSPFMKPTGKGKGRVLIIAEAPGENEDRRGIQLCGNAGNELMRILGNIGIHMRRDCWLTNAMICRPFNSEGNREPTAKEISYCRPNLANTLRELNPEVVIPLGKVSMASLLPLVWKDSEADTITRWVGWQVPVQKGNFWMCPTFHPSHLLHANNEGANTVELHMTKHLSRAFALEGRPWDPNPPNFKGQVQIRFSPRQAAREVRAMIDTGVPLAFDFETTTLKPDGPHAAILCCAVSDGKVSIAYPWLGEAIEATRELVCDPKVPKIAANLQFEDRWCRAKLGTPVRGWTPEGFDTCLGAHWLDCRSHISSLKFQSFVRFGMPDYDSHLDKYKKPAKKHANDCNAPNRLAEVEPEVLLSYCGLDALLEVMVYENQLQEWEANCG